MTRVLLAPGVDRAAVDAHAIAQGWRLVTVMPKRQGRPRQVVYATARGEERVTLVDDHRIDARYLVVHGQDPEGTAATVRAALPFIDEAAVRAMLETERARAVSWLGVVAPERAEETWSTIIRDARESDDPAVREAGRFAAEATGWAELCCGGASEAPSAPCLPERPRLVSSVLARLHVVDGAPKVILHDPRSGAFFELEVGSFRVLELADGTRDVDALCLALASRSEYRGEADLLQLFMELDAVGVLADGLDAPAPPLDAPETPAERPLEVLPGFTLSCDGRGSCCRFYGSIAFSPVDALRARLITEPMDLPIPAGSLFMPVTGAQIGEGEPLAVAQVDGRCVFLEADARCGLQRRGGPEAKPFPCRFYPATLMDDGTSVRVSLAPECACVFASAGRTDGAPLVPPEARTLFDLGPEVSVVCVPDPVPLARARTAPREELSRWSSRLVRALEESSLDAVALAWTLADGMAEDGLDLGALERALERASAPALARVTPWMEALAERASQAATAHESWRSASDLSRRVGRWIADALSRSAPADLLSGAIDPGAERFYLRALAHGHRLALEGRTLEHGLRDRTARLLAARAMALAAPPHDPSAEHPLALLEAAVRNLGIAPYADELR